MTGYSSVLGSVAQSDLSDSKQVLKGFADKYGSSQGVNRLWKSGTNTTSEIRVAQVVRSVEHLAREAEKTFERGMKEHKEKIDKADKQNRETNSNVEHMNRDLDRISREAAEKADKGPKK